MIAVLGPVGGVILVLAGLLGPGLCWARACRWPLPGLAGGVISVLGLFAAVQLYQAIGVPITFVSLGLGQAVLALAGLAFGRSVREADRAAEPQGWGEAWLALPALPMVAVALSRAVFQPLSGADVDFRWNHLAEMIVRQGSLAHYPPVTSADFMQYFWPDGIAPLLSGLYAWTYLAADSLARQWSLIPVLLQVAGLLVLVFSLARHWGGPRAGWLACALAGGTMLLQFAFNLGQETGLTALGVGGMIFYLLEWRRTARADLLVPAAAAAALAAGAREYGVVFPVVAAGWLLAEQAGWRRALGFGLGALALPLAWHLRNWVLTGNPLYAQDLAGLFPLNPVFTQWMRGYVAIYSQPLKHLAGWLEIGRLLAVTALPATLGLLAAAICLRPVAGRGLLFGVAAATVACWLASVPFTAGGLFYSMRVLSPLLLLGCAAGGAVLARWIPGRRHLGGVWLGCLLFGADAALRAWTIPLNPYQTPARDWPRAGAILQREYEANLGPFLEAAARAVNGRVLTEAVVAPPAFRALGRDTVPIWSPEAAGLFAAGDPEQTVAALRAAGITHVLIMRAEASDRFYAQTGALERIKRHLQPVMANDTFILLALTP